MHRPMRLNARSGCSRSGQTRSCKKCLKKAEMKPQSLAQPVLAVDPVLVGLQRGLQLGGKKFAQHLHLVSVFRGRGDESYACRGQDRRC